MARSLGYLDWANQPDPFRRYDGSDLTDLIAPLAEATGDHEWTTRSYDSLFAAPGTPLVEPGLPAVSVFLRFSLGLSAWKAVPGSRWALRVNPSSGNLHPTEGYVLLAPGIAGEAGVWHYRPDAHAIERRCAIDGAAWPRAGVTLPRGAFLAALSSVHWREAWKYGERAFRYCQHDTGHAIAAMRMAAAMMGWSVRLLPDWDSASLSAALGLDRDDDFGEAEREEPECMLLVSPEPFTHADLDRQAGLKPCPTPDGCPSPPDPVPPAPLSLASACARGTWTGRANPLSHDRVAWEAIDDVAEATRARDNDTPDLARVSPSSPTGVAVERPGGAAMAASRLLLQRRSAQAMSGAGEMSLDAFCLLLRRLLPGEAPPWDVLPYTPRLHLVLFVHRVAGLDPGLYAFPRSAAGLVVMTRELRDDFAWIHAPGVPEDLPLHLLMPADVRRIAAALSCQQAIASDGSFAVAMLAEFDAALEAGGAAAYRHLFWEAGVIGQVLYLDAEAAGVRGTGIGCYFDDSVHDVLGIGGHTLQSLYHFTVGHPVEDTRLQTEPGYAWEHRQG
jgi:SagB-type dehydrogenase family enzyme